MKKYKTNFITYTASKEDVDMFDKDFNKRAHLFGPDLVQASAVVVLIVYSLYLCVSELNSEEPNLKTALTAITLMALSAHLISTSNVSKSTENLQMPKKVREYFSA